MKKLLLLFITALPWTGSNAQQSANLPVPAGKTAPVIHLHLDKDIYLPGETIWFKAYLLLGGMPDTLSGSLFTELLDEEGNTISRFVAPVEGGTAYGQLEPGRSLTRGNYIIRAFTRSSISTESNNVYSRIITIAGDTPVLPGGELTASLQLFAEGGTFIQDVENTIAFKAMYSNGQPFPLQGIIRDNTGRFIDSIHATHDGMGSFLFFPAANENYYAEWTDHLGKKRLTPFPEATVPGATLHVQQSGDQLTYFIQNPVPQNNLEELILSVSSGNNLLWSGIFPRQAGITGSINTRNIPDGIIQLTVSDRNYIPLAERVVFINHGSASAEVNFHVSQMGTEKRGLNILELRTSDSLPQNLSIAVSDADMHLETAQNIYTDLLLTSDIRGYVYKPAQYFNSPAADMAGPLDLVMLTNGWRRYTVPDPDSLQTAMQDDVIAEDYINFSGQVTNPDSTKIRGSLLSMIMRTTDSAGNSFAISPDDNGFFHQGGLIFRDSATLYYYFLRSNPGTEVRIIPGKTLVFPQVPFTLPDNWKYLLPGKSFQPLPEIKNKILFTAWRDTFEQKAKILQEVVIRSKNRNPLQAMDDKYAKNYKGDKGGRMYDFMHNPTAVNRADPVRYMFDWMLPMRFLHSNFEIYINEIIAPPPMLKYLRSDQIAFVKYVPEDFQKPYCSGIYIYLKTEDDYLKEIQEKLKNKMSRIKLAGYSPKKEFYHPDYSLPVNNAGQGPDIQTTLFWQPVIKTDRLNNTFTIRFCNNDISSNLRVVVEGINSAGKLVHLETTLR